MPASNVNYPLPLTRLNPFYPGQFGVPGAWTETGLRLHATGAIFYVDPNNTDANDNRDGTDPTAPLATIQGAISKCQAYRGDVIAVMANGAWTYADLTSGYNTQITESVVLSVPGVRLVGVFPSGCPGVVWSAAATGAFALTVTAIDCLVEGFAFVGAAGGSNGIYCEWDGATLFGENLTVRNCYFHDDLDTAIQLEYSWYCRIIDNWFEECDAYGVYVDAAGSGIAYCEIARNWFHDVAAALSLRGAENCDIHHNHILNSNAQGAGVATDEGIDTTGGGDNLVHQNVMSCLLPVPANGDYDDLNTAAATDAWIQNMCMNGPSVTNPT